MPTTEEQINSFIAAADANLTMWQNKKAEIDAATQANTDATNTAITDLNTAKANIVADETATAQSRTNVEANETAVANSKANVDANQTAINNTLATLQAATPETRYVQDITIGGSADRLYPIWWQFPSGAAGVSKLQVTRQFDWNGGAGEQPLNPGISTQGHLTLELEGQGYTYNGEANFLEIKRYFFRYNNTASHVSFLAYCKARMIDPQGAALAAGASVNFSNQNPRYSGVYLRGGGLTYRIIKNWVGDINFHDGSDELERLQGTVNNTQWYAEPIDFINELRPSEDLTAFVAAV